MISVSFSVCEGTGAPQQQMLFDAGLSMVSSMALLAEAALEFVLW